MKPLSSPATDLVSLPMLIFWLETKPPEEQYNFNDCHGACLFSQYMTAFGISAHADDFQTWTALHDKYGWVAWDAPWTFGAALARTKQLHKEQHSTCPSAKTFSTQPTIDAKPSRTF